MGDFFAGRRINERARSGSAKNNCTGGNVRSARVKKFTEWNLRNVPQVQNTTNVYTGNYVRERENRVSWLKLSRNYAFYWRIEQVFMKFRYFIGEYAVRK